MALEVFFPHHYIMQVYVLYIYYIIWARILQAQRCYYGRSIALWIEGKKIMYASHTYDTSTYRPRILYAPPAVRRRVTKFKREILLWEIFLSLIFFLRHPGSNGQDICREREWRQIHARHPNTHIYIPFVIIYTYNIRCCALSR